MNRAFFIRVTVHCDNNTECFAKFDLGHDKQFANNLFRRLKGNREVTEKDPLQMEFIEMKNELPLSIDIISCTLEDIGENSKVITRELFKSKLLSLM